MTTSASQLSATGGFAVPTPVNEPIQGYAPGSTERETLAATIADQRAAAPIEAPMRIGADDVRSQDTFEVRAPHDHALHLATVFAASEPHVEAAIDAALGVAEEWAATPLHDRLAVFLRAADLLSGPWRSRVNAATILGQSKSVHQAEIDAACELIDFLRFNCAFAEQIHAEQPTSSPGVWNRTDHRPLEGFVLALTPFNFTAIAGNLPTAPAMMGNVVIWKPSEKQAFAAQMTMDLLRAAGLPDGVINLVHGDGALVSDVAMAHPAFAGLHYTGSTAVFRQLWRKTADRIDSYRSYPRIVGETGGKDFVLVHPSADPAAVVVGLGRGAFEYQGQKCSAASRAYVPASLWSSLRDDLAGMASEITVGDVGDLSTFCGAVIDEVAFERVSGAIAKAGDAGAEVLVGGDSDRTQGWFVDPTVLVTDDPRSHTMVTELFGPVLTVFPYDDSSFDDTTWAEVVDLVDTTSPYALTGAVFATDRRALDVAQAGLRHAAGNFYLNDKPTGAVVGQQPFGGARASGTNDKAGAPQNLQRWVSSRSIKESFVPPTDWRYPHQG
ncbi:L-glutamate gamma-semialdehyde dehydrogenase [Euzebya tangerina]|uniref:L-glutamate gamma-semialdehyde dehydrogenase n=1 Tax=Euzebya tangerina TaxID=591198 RepID=UPI000E314AC4|nr:L-glutamate gamma-semialdehyde dehydrogenase [Euzebya tangerina]